MGCTSLVHQHCTVSTCAVSCARELSCFWRMLAICSVHTDGSLMITSSGCRTQPRTELFKTLSMAVSLECVGVACSSSSSIPVSGDGSEEDDGRVDANWTSSLRVVSHDLNKDRSSHSPSSAFRAVYSKYTVGK